MRQVKIRIEIDYITGKMDARVVDNHNGQGCSHNENEDILKDLLEAEAPEFGKIDIIDSGLTEEGFKERMQGRTKPVAFKPMKGTSISDGKIEVGFGV